MYFIGDVVSWNITYAGRDYVLTGMIVSLTGRRERPYRVTTDIGEVYEPWPHMLRLVSRKIDCKEVNRVGTESKER